MGENRELQLREERNKELAELVNRTVETELESEPAGKDKIQRDERNKELALLTNRKVDSIDLIQEDKTTLLKEERAKELLEISNRAIDADSEMEKSEQIWNE